jgi:hypothetical protein
MSLRGKVTLFIIALIMAGGCSTNSSSDRTPPATPSPGSIAVAYARDLFSGHWQAGRSLVLPEDRNTYDALATVIRQNVVSARNVSVGSDNLSGNTDTVVLNGQFCTASGVAQSAATSCIGNSNPKTSNKAFTVALTRYAGRWYVYYPCGRTGAPRCPTPSGKQGG